MRSRKLPEKVTVKRGKVRVKTVKGRAKRRSVEEELGIVGINVITRRTMIT